MSASVDGLISRIPSSSSSTAANAAEAPDCSACRSAMAAAVESAPLEIKAPISVWTASCSAASPAADRWTSTTIAASPPSVEGTAAPISARASAVVSAPWSINASMVAPATACSAVEVPAASPRSWVARSPAAMVSASTQDNSACVAALAVCAEPRDSISARTKTPSATPRSFEATAATIVATPVVGSASMSTAARATMLERPISGVAVAAPASSRIACA